MTHTYATLEVSAAAFEEIKGKLEAADYGHAIIREGEPGHESIAAIDMHGIALVPMTDPDILDAKIRRIVEEARGKPRAVRYAAFDRIVALFDAPALVKTVGESAPAADQTESTGT